MRPNRLHDRKQHHSKRSTESETNTVAMIVTETQYPHAQSTPTQDIQAHRHPSRTALPKPNTCRKHAYCEKVSRGSAKTPYGEVSVLSADVSERTYSSTRPVPAKAPLTRRNPLSPTLSPLHPGLASKTSHHPCHTTARSANPPSS